MSTKKELIRGSVETVILKMLSEKPMYGYEMIKTVNDKTDGYFEWKEGSIYPCLHRLEAENAIISSWEECNGKLRKYYTITPSGLLAAKERVNEAKNFCHALNLLLAKCEA